MVRTNTTLTYIRVDLWVQIRVKFFSGSLWSFVVKINPSVDYLSKDFIHCVEVEVVTLNTVGRAQCQLQMEQIMVYYHENRKSWNFDVLMTLSNFSYSCITKVCRVCKGFIHFPSTECRYSPPHHWASLIRQPPCVPTLSRDDECTRHTEASCELEKLGMKAVDL